MTHTFLRSLPALALFPLIFTSPVARASSLKITPDPAIARYAVAPKNEPDLTSTQLLRLLRKKVKYVFVLYQENRSYDSYFGTFPGGDGLFSQPAAQTRGFYQEIIDTDGTVETIHPFRIEPVAPYYSADTEDVDHSHPAILKKMDTVNGVPQMDQFALTEEREHSPTGNPSLEAKQYGELEMAYEDGDTIPFIWRYANRFVLFDHIFQEMVGPSTPGNLAIIGAQTGSTQLMLHPEDAYNRKGGDGTGVPVLGDLDPFWGSKLDKTSGQPSNHPAGHPQMNLTYATLPLTLQGKSLQQTTQHDKNRPIDLADVEDDIPFITKENKEPVGWGWYEEGYDREPTDPKIPSGDPLDAEGSHASYVTHHNGPEYFGYIANNSHMSDHLHGLQDFETALANHTLPVNGGLFYVKGGFQNILGLAPADPDTHVQRDFQGDDDHPGYSDAQISEAQIADVVNKIAAGPYWGQCAIIITWDDSEGDYDQLPPISRALGPDGSQISDGPRVPLLLLSPYAKTHVVAHAVGDHASVVKFVDVLFNLTPLADLPDELKGRAIGKAKGLANQGPFDDLTPDVTDLTSAFDPARLSGAALPLPGSYAETPEAVIKSVPPMMTHSEGKRVPYGLAQIGVLPTDYLWSIPNEIPSDFNPRPRTDPGVLTATTNARLP